MALRLKKGTPVRVKELTGVMVASPFGQYGYPANARVEVKTSDGQTFWCVVPTEFVEELSDEG